jgi:hypothetical protein
VVSAGGREMGQSEEDILSLVHAADASAFDLYYGDRESQLHNYVSISQGATSIINFIDRAAEDKNWECAAHACLLLARIVFQDAKNTQTASETKVPAPIEMEENAMEKNAKCPCPCILITPEQAIHLLERCMQVKDYFMELKSQSPAKKQDLKSQSQDLKSQSQDPKSQSQEPKSQSHDPESQKILSDLKTSIEKWWRHARTNANWIA